MTIKGLLQYATMGLLFLPALLAIFWDSIFQREIEEIPSHWHGSYILRKDDRHREPDLFVPAYLTGIQISANEISIFGDKRIAEKITVPRFARKHNKISVHHSHDEKVEMYRLSDELVFISEMMETPDSADSDSWEYFETYKVKRQSGNLSKATMSRSVTVSP